MRARRRQADQHVADLDLAAVDDLRFLGDRHAKTGEVEITRLIHARHFRGLAAHQRAAGELAALCDALDDLGRDFRIELAGRVVIEEEQRSEEHTSEIQSLMRTSYA